MERTAGNQALYHATEFKDVACLRRLLEAKPLWASVSYCLSRALDFTPLGTNIYGSTDCCDEQGCPGTLLPEEVPERDYAELTAWLIERGSALPKSITGGSDAVQEVLRRFGVPDED